jgi:phosphate transport system protein
MQPVRQGFSDELEQLRLQVEIMGVRVDQNLELMRTFLEHGDLQIAERAIAADDDIDAMNVSLTERCHDLLVRESPVASDLRFIVSVMRVLGELERIGDLALRVVKVGEGLDVVRSFPEVYDVLQTMAETAIDQYRRALTAWSAQDLAAAEELARSGQVLDLANDALVRRLLRLAGPDAVPAAVHSLVIGKALDRIADHASIVGSRLRYLITGDPGHLASEIR